MCVSHELVEEGATPGCASATRGADGKGRVGPKKVAMGVSVRNEGFSSPSEKTSLVDDDAFAVASGVLE